MPLRFKVAALREYYLLPEEDAELISWAEWLAPSRCQGYSGWLTEPTDDPGEREVETMTLLELREFLDGWSGDVWSYVALPSWFNTDGLPRPGHAEYAVECYETGRSSVDRLFIERA